MNMYTTLMLVCIIAALVLFGWAWFEGDKDD
jgi:predicted negative regulator of RcsB-dependent stress response